MSFPRALLEIAATVVAGFLLGALGSIAFLGYEVTAMVASAFLQSLT